MCSYLHKIFILAKSGCYNHAGGLMKLTEDGSMLSFDSIPVSTDGSWSDLRPHSSHVVSFSPMYIQVGRAHCWRGATRFNKKSNSTIIDIKSFLARNQILFITER
jgi:hypothetical protein